MTIKEKELREALHNLLALSRPHFSDDTQALAIEAAEAALMIEPETPEETVYRERAVDQYDCEGDQQIDIDDDAVVSIGEDGAFVAAWVFVSNEGMPIGCSDCDTMVTTDDPYYATPCGTYCTSCMRNKHAVGCEICRNEFVITVKRTRKKKD